MEFERLENLYALVNTWNDATCPWIARTDEEHAIERARAKTAMQSLRRNYIEGVDYREFESGRLGVIRNAN